MRYGNNLQVENRDPQPTVLIRNNLYGLCSTSIRVGRCYIVNVCSGETKCYMKLNKGKRHITLTYIISNNSLKKRENSITEGTALMTAPKYKIKRNIIWKLYLFPKPCLILHWHFHIILVGIQPCVDCNVVIQSNGACWYYIIIAIQSIVETFVLNYKKHKIFVIFDYILIDKFWYLYYGYQ